MLSRPAITLLSLLSGLAACNGPGSRCAVTDDCRTGLRCELDQCVAEDDPTCGYLRRCLKHQASPLRGLLEPSLLGQLDSHPDEQTCRQRLRLMESTGKHQQLTSVCGPRVPRQ